MVSPSFVRIKLLTDTSGNSSFGKTGSPRWLPLLFFLASSLSQVEAQAPALIQAPTLTKKDAVTLTDKKDAKIEYTAIDKDPSITLQGCSNISIYCCDVHSIKLVNCTDITIQNCWIHDSTNNGVDAYGCKNLSVQGCRIEKVSSALYAQESSGIQFLGNYAENVLGPFPRGQMVQFDTVTGSGNLIKNNYCVNFKGQSKPEDCINMFHSQGDPKSPILIEGNYLMGDPVHGSAGKSKNGSGILLGDNDTKGGGGGGYQICRGNIVINAGQQGIEVAGGDAIQVEKNTVIGAQSDVSSVGMDAWNQSNAPGGTVSFSDNHVYWINKNGEPASWWQGSGFTEVKLEGNQFDDPSLIDHALPHPPTKAPMPPAPVTRDGAMQLPWNTNATGH